LEARQTGPNRGESAERKSEGVRKKKGRTTMIQFAENKQMQPYLGSGYSYAETAGVRNLHRQIPEFEQTPLGNLEALAAHFGIRALLIKDESHRFGLKAFKGLGGIYAVFRILCRELGLDPESTTPEMLQKEPLRSIVRNMSFATTTDGNHGKGVSWAAKVFGCKAHVFMPVGSAEVRAQAIRDAGNAEVAITRMHYDDCVAWTAKKADEMGWHLVQDTSWPGYEEVPGWIMQGYTTIYFEAIRQMNAMGLKAPTHLFLQAGVGSMAGSIAAAAVSEQKENLPVIVTVESSEAACFFDSFQRGNGQAAAAHGLEKTIMAGLNCSVPCTLAWDILGKCAAGGFACSDDVTCQGMRRLAHPIGQDPVIVSGESGAVTTGLLELLLTKETNRDLARKLHLDQDSVVLLISTEGDTDPVNYRRIVNEQEVLE